MTISIEASISDDIFDMAGDYRRTVLTCTMPPNKGDLPGGLVREATYKARAALDGHDVLMVPAVHAWRSAFRRAGINPSRSRPALEALLRRAAKGVDLQLGLPLIDIGTAVSLATLCPVGMHSVDDVDPDVPLELRLATGDERFTDFSGAISEVGPGEVVYKSGNEVLTRRWVWRQGAVGSMTSQTRRLAVNVDILGDQDDTAAVSMLTELLILCGAPSVGVERIAVDSKSVHLKWAD